jgi:hypothetical protein
VNLRYRRLALVVAGSTALIAALAMAAVFGAVFARIISTAHGATGDYIAFYSAGWLVRSADGAALYDPAVIEAAERALYPGTFDEPFGFVMPVFVAWAFAPLSMLPYTVSYLAWVAINCALLASLILLVDRYVLAGLPGNIRLLFLGAAACSMPAIATIAFGQVDFVILTGLVLGYLLLRAERPWLAGIALCLVFVKPHFLAGVLLLLLAMREWRPLLVLAAGGVSLLVLPALATTPDVLVENVRVLAAFPGQQDDMSVNAPVMANWRGFIVSLTNSGNVWFWAPGLLAIAAAATAIAWPLLSAARSASLDRAYSLAMLLPILVSPHLHTQSLSLLLLPGALALRAYMHGSSAREEESAIVTAILAAYAALFFLPFFAIQGLSLTFFALGGAFLATAFRWPGLVTGRPASNAHPERTPLPRAA